MYVYVYVCVCVYTSKLCISKPIAFFPHTCRALTNKLLNPLQIKIEEWKKTTVQMDREHEKGMPEKLATNGAEGRIGRLCGLLIARPAGIIMCTL